MVCAALLHSFRRNRVIQYAVLEEDDTAQRDEDGELRGFSRYINSADQVCRLLFCSCALYCPLTCVSSAWIAHICCRVANGQLDEMESKPHTSTEC